MAVERRLRSRPIGRIVGDDTTEDIRNRPVPWVEHVPEPVFRRIFALTLRDLAGLDAETWAGVQDRLVGSMGASDLRPPRQVAAELERAASELWRPDRRGKPKVRAIRAEIRELHRRRREAVDRDRHLRELVRTHAEEVERLRAAKTERERERLAVERAQLLVPIRSQLRRVQELLEDAGPEEELRGLPPHPAEELERRRTRLQEAEQRLEELRAEAGDPRARKEAFTERDRAVLARREEIRALSAIAPRLEQERTHAQASAREADDLQRRLDATSEQLLSMSWRDLDTERLARLRPGEVREAVRAFESARGALRAAEAEAHRREAEVGEETPPASLTGSLIVLLSGMALLWLGLDDGTTWVIAAGAAVSTAGVAFLALWLYHRRRFAGAGGRGAGDTIEERVANRTAAAANACDVARERLVDALGGLPVSPVRLADPDSLLVADVERLQQLALDRHQRINTLEAFRRRVDEVRSEALRLCAELELPQPAEDGGLDDTGVAAVPEAVYVLQAACDEAIEHERFARAADVELARLDRRIEQAESDVRDARDAVHTLETRIAALAGGDLRLGIATAEARLEALEGARRLQAELEHNHPDLDEIRVRIREAEQAEESWTLDDEALAAKRARIAELDRDIETLTRSTEALAKDIEHLGGEATVDVIDSEIEALKAEESRWIAERDRRWVLAQLIRDADRRFRDAHQPDMVRRASRHLERLTAGRYDRLVVDEAGEGDVFGVAGPATDSVVPLSHPISTGTLEQAYLAIRLGMVDHLDRAGERLPLFVDEVFVNWDEERIGFGLSEVAAVAEHRQLFVFTCHTEVARALEALGGRIIEMEPPR